MPTTSLSNTCWRARLQGCPWSPSWEGPAGLGGTPWGWEGPRGAGPSVAGNSRVRPVPILFQSFPGCLGCYNPHSHSPHPTSRDELRPQSTHTQSCRKQGPEPLPSPAGTAVHGPPMPGDQHCSSLKKRNVDVPTRDNRSLLSSIVAAQRSAPSANYSRLMIIIKSNRI